MGEYLLFTNKKEKTQFIYFAFFLSKYMTKTKQPLDLYIPTVSDIISIGGPEGWPLET